MKGIDPVYSGWMAQDSLHRLDLNLLTALEALLAERNVTRAAERLGVSQPAASAALGRLRRHFGDPLLRRVGNHFELTPLAHRLTLRIGPAAAAVRRVFDAREDFDPLTQEREFTVLGSDYAVTVVGPALSRLVRAAAPGVTLRFKQSTPSEVETAVDSLRAADGLIIPVGFVEGLPRIELFEDPWVCLVARDNARVGASASRELLAELPWVVLYDLPLAYSPGDKQLRLSGLDPRVEVVVDTFWSMPALVAGTDRVALVQRRLADQLVAHPGVRAVSCPYDIAPIRESFWWHPIHADDPGHRWFRRMVQRAGREVGERGDAAVGL